MRRALITKTKYGYILVVDELNEDGSTEVDEIMSLKLNMLDLNFTYGYVSINEVVKDSHWNRDANL